jgi:hypothetical protein
MALQVDENIGLAKGRSLKLVLNGGIKWNASFSMILQALLLRKALELLILTPSNYDY